MDEEMKRLREIIAERDKAIFDLRKYIEDLLLTINQLRVEKSSLVDFSTEQNGDKGSEENDV